MQDNLLPALLPEHHLTICPHPFLTERINRVAAVGLTIQEILDSIEELPKECTTSVQVNGTPIRPEIWSSYRPPEGSYIAIRVVPIGDGDKDPLRSFLMLVVMIASIYVGGVVAATYGAFYGSLAAAATTMIGTLLVNALCPPAQARLSERAGVNRDGIVYSITGARNQINPFGPIPTLFGEHRITPFYGARPYTDIAGNDQYLRLLFVPTYLPAFLHTFKVGETDLSDFSFVELEVKQFASDDDPSLYTNVIYEETVNALLLEADGWTQRTTQIETDEISVDVVCPLGLCTYDTYGNRQVRQVYYELQYAIKDSGNWLDFSEWSGFGALVKGPMVPMLMHPGDEYYDTLYAKQIFRVILNLYTQSITVIVGQPTTEPYPAQPPTVPEWSCSLARITFPQANSILPITDSMITDERSDSCFERQNAGDFLVSERDTPDSYVDVTAGNYRINPSILGQTTAAVRKGIRFQVTQGQYDVRMKRITADTDSALIYDDLYWNTLRSITYESPTTKDDICLIALRIRATDQLSGIIDTFNCIGESICKDWNAGSSTWVEQPTSNPASLYRYVLQHPSNKRAVVDAKIDLVKLQEWHDFCAPTVAHPNVSGPAVDKGGGKVGIPCTAQPFVTNDVVWISDSVNYDGRHSIDETSSTNEIVITATYVSETFTGDEDIGTLGLQYNSVIDYQSSVSAVLQQIAAAGFASPTYVDGKYSVIVDQLQSTPIQHFTPRNSWNFSGSKTYPRIPHALRILFANRLRNWELDERVVYADGYDEETATIYEQLELPGITDPDLAYKFGRYHLAVLILRPERYSFYADVENLVSTRGDLIRVTHDVPLWGVATGRIKSVIDNGTHATSVVMDSVMTMLEGRTYGIRFRLNDGSTLLAVVDTDIGEQTTLTFTTPILLVDAPSVDDLGLFGETDEESVELLILSIEPGEDLTARITCVDHSPAIYTASTGLIGEHDSHITSPYGAVAQSGIPEIYQIRSDESVLYRDTDGSLRPRIVITLKQVGGYKDQIAYTEVNWKIYETDEPWKTLQFTGYTQELSIIDVEEGIEYAIRLRYILTTGDSTDWCVEEQHTVIGKTTAPDVPTSISATSVFAGVKLQWTNPVVLDFQYVGIWRAESDVFPGGDAVYVVPGKPGEITSFIDYDVSYNTTYYYWLKSYDTAGNASTQSASVNGIPSQIIADDIFDTIQSEDYVSGVSGWFIGFRGEHEGYAEFNDVTIRGELIAGEIHIPDKTTAESFHVATDGDTWWGCAEANFITDPENAVAYILKDGTVKFASGTITGTFDLYGSMNVHSGGDIALIGADNNPGTLLFTGTADVKAGLNAAGASFEIVPMTDATTACSLGDHGVGIFGEDLRWSVFEIHSMDMFNLTIYDSNTDEDAYQCTIYGITNSSNSIIMLRSRFASINYNALLTVTGSIKAFYPDPTDTIDLGTSSYKWENFFVRRILVTNEYLNFNTTQGAGGYGFRDNSGAMEFKNSGGSWSPFGHGELGATANVASAGTLVITGNAHNVLLSGITNFNGATIDGSEGPDGHLLVIRSTGTLTMTNDGNIKGRAAFIFNSANKTLTLMGRGGTWVELDRSDNV